MRSPRPRSPPDYALISVIVLLVTFGLVMLASASSDLAKLQFDDSYFYLRHQLLFGLVVGIIGFLAGAFIYYQRFRKWALVLFALNIVTMILVFSPLGIETKGASRWLDLGSFSFQPGEILKLTFLLYLASWISKTKTRRKSFVEGFLPFLILVGTAVLLLIIQPSTTTAIILFTASVVMYFTAGAHIRFLVAIALLAVTALSILVYITPYRLERITTFFNPQEDQLGSGYHINQALIAIGSGGITGVGYGQSTTKLNYLPEPIGDSIFAIIGEEFGFIGSSIILMLFLIFTWRGFSIARATTDTFGRLLVIGFTSIISIQAVVNIAAISGLIPLTGVPLPFISYGGTALAVFLTMSGIIINISRYRT